MPSASPATHSLLHRRGDSLTSPGVTLFDTASMRTDTLSSGKGTFKQLAFDDDGQQLAFLADRDTSKAKQRYFSLYSWKAGQDSATRPGGYLDDGQYLMGGS